MVKEIATLLGDKLTFSLCSSKPQHNAVICKVWILKHLIIVTKLYEPEHDKTNQNDLCTQQNSGQPGQVPSLIRGFAVRMKKAWVLSYPLSAQRILIRLGRCPGWSESLLGTQIILLVLSWGGSVIFFMISYVLASQVFLLVLKVRQFYSGFNEKTRIWLFFPLNRIKI